jgi:hypothetical protein
MRVPNGANSVGMQYLIRWYDMTPEGGEVEKKFTYHNFQSGWYLTLDSEWAQRLAVMQLGNSFEFYVWNESYDLARELFTLYIFTGAGRDEEVSRDGRFALYRSEGIAYGAKLADAAADFGLTEENLTECFRLIRQDWQTGET